MADNVLGRSALLRLKDDYDGAKTHLAELQGKQKYVDEQLKAKWGCSSVEEAQKVLADMESELDNLARQILEASAAIREAYDI